MKNMSIRDKLCKVLVAYQRSEYVTEEAIAKIAEILDIKIESDIKFGTVFTTRYGGKCVAMSEPDEDGQFWMYGTSGSKQFQNVSNVMKVHKKESERMIRVISDMPDSPGAWYNQPIYSGYDE